MGFHIPYHQDTHPVPFFHRDTGRPVRMVGAGRFRSNGKEDVMEATPEGKIRWRVGGAEDSMEVKGGVVMVKDNAIKVCID